MIISSDKTIIRSTIMLFDYQPGFGYGLAYLVQSWYLIKGSPVSGWIVLIHTLHMGHVHPTTNPYGIVYWQLP